MVGVAIPVYGLAGMVTVLAERLSVGEGLPRLASRSAVRLCQCRRYGCTIRRKEMSKVIPFSYSSMSAYETCPKQYYETRITKQWKQAESPQMKWGNEVHKALENAVKYARPLPANMAQYQWALDLVNARKNTSTAHAEMAVALTEDLRPTGFWDTDAWGRGKIDILIEDDAKTTAFNGDYKTGKTKPNSKQLELSTLMCFASYPTLEVVRTGFLWLPEPDLKKRITQKLYRRTDGDHVETLDARGGKLVTTIEDLWEPFRQVVAEMVWSERNNTWPAKPSGLCRAWCPVLSCPHNGLREK